MDIDNLRAAFRAQPFRPFVIRTGSGEAYTLRHPEMIAFSPDVSVLLLIPGPKQVAMIDVASVTEITYDFNPAGNRA